MVSKQSHATALAAEHAAFKRYMRDQTAQSHTDWQIASLLVNESARRYIGSLIQGTLSAEVVR